MAAEIAGRIEGIIEVRIVAVEAKASITNADLMVVAEQTISLHGPKNMAPNDNLRRLQKTF